MTASNACCQSDSNRQVPIPEQLLWEPTQTSVSKSISNDNLDTNRISLESSGKLFALTCDKAVIVRSLPEGKEVRRFPSTNAWCTPAWSPKTNDLAFSDSASSVSVHSVVDGSLRFQVSNLPETALHLEWSPSGDFLAIGGFDGLLKICNASDGSIAKTLDVGRETVCSLAYSKSGDRLGIRTQGELLLVWNPATDNFTTHRKKQGINGELAYGATKYASSSAQGIRVFDLATDQVAYTVASRFPIALAFAVDEAFLVFADNSGSVVLIGPKGERLHQFRCTTGYVRDMALSPDSRSLVVIDSKSQVTVWDLSSIDRLKEATQPSLPPKVTINGRYSDLLQIHSAPKDRVTFGDFHELGVPSGTSSSDRAYWIYAAPNWYVFARSSIGMDHPRHPLPQPIEVPNAKRRIWLAFPNASCRDNFEAVVATLPGSVREVAAASLTYRHNFSFPEERKNQAIAILSLDVIPGADTATVLESLARESGIRLGEGTVLTEAEAKQALVFPIELGQLSK